MKMTYKLLLSVSLMVAFAVHAKPCNEEKCEHKHPPQEAIDACENHAENDSVTFTGRKGETLEATCMMKGEQLVAVPNKHRSAKH